MAWGDIELTRSDIRSFAAKAIVVVAALSSAHGPAVAQETGDPQDSDIVVEAPRPIPVPTPPVPEGEERNPYSGAPLVVTTVRLPVLYGDLDLKNPADAERLMTRIDRIAQDACTYLDRLYPLSSDPECVGKSVTKAKAAAKAAIAGAADDSDDSDDSSPGA